MVKQTTHQNRRERTMSFFDFYSHSKFTLLERGTSNWDYYTMQYEDQPVSVVAIAKPGSGAADCGFGSLDYYNRRKATRAQ